MVYRMIPKNLGTFCVSVLGFLGFSVSLQLMNFLNETAHNTWVVNGPRKRPDNFEIKLEANFLFALLRI